MTPLSPDQRNYYYLIEAARVGIHKPILAALYAVHQTPTLEDGETGLGLAPAHRVGLDQLNTFAEQVQYGANTIRALTTRLADDGWQGADLWNSAAGRYSDRLVAAVAKGYAPAATELGAAQLEPCDPEALLQAYLADIDTDYDGAQVAQNLAELDGALLAFAERVPPNYGQLAFQQEALIELVRIWRGLDTADQVFASLEVLAPDGVPDPAALDRALVDFVGSAVRYYAGYPYQREALIRLVQFWRERDSREDTIALLLAEPHLPEETDLEIVDPALIAFIQTLPTQFEGRGDQRFALTEGYRNWHGLDSRATAIRQLGVDPDRLVDQSEDPDALRQAARLLDRALLEFAATVPSQYGPTAAQREALIRLVQIWRRLANRTATLQSLFTDLRRLQQAERAAPDAMPAPVSPPVVRRPPRWTPDNIQLGASIVANGNFTWAEATRGGTRMPPNQATVDAMVRIAALAQQARDRIGRPFLVTSWYRPPEVNRRVGGASRSRHIVGDAIDFYCQGLTGNQVYWALDPWWPGGLGRYTRYPALVHLDARGRKVRWTH